MTASILQKGVGGQAHALGLLLEHGYHRQRRALRHCLAIVQQLLCLPFGATDSRRLLKVVGMNKKIHNLRKVHLGIQTFAQHKQSALSKGCLLAHLLGNLLDGMRYSLAGDCDGFTERSHLLATIAGTYNFRRYNQLIVLRQIQSKTDDNCTI